MRWKFLGLRKWLAAACGVVLVGTATSRADEAELRALIEQQNQQIQALKQQMEAQAAKPADPPAPPGSVQLNDNAVRKIVGDYLKDNPGAGMPASVQTGYSTSGGFVIRSTNDPSYVKWDDECKIPFELRFRGRVQMDYYGYKVTDTTNHLTNKGYKPAVGDFSQLEIKRLRLIWEGTVFDPNLRYHFELDGNTRGLGGTQNNRGIANNVPGGSTANQSPQVNEAASSPIGGGVTVDHAVRLFSAYVAYDFHGCNSEKGCGPDCPAGTYKYAPTYTLIAGKIKPFFSFEEYCGSGNQQFVEYAMPEWFFDADDDNLLMAAGVQVKARDDRLFASALVTNGSESQFPNTQMDRLPGFNAGFWYDFGGTWNEQKHKWDLWGDCPSDIDYSYNPVLRVGATSNIVPLDRRTIYGDLEQSRYFTMSAGPGGTRLINLLNGDGGATTNGFNAVDSFDVYSGEAFATLKYHGFSILSDWFVRDMTNFKTTPTSGNVILYTDAAGKKAVFPNKDLVDFGTVLQGGYFIIPKKLEVVARVSVIEGESGDIIPHGPAKAGPMVGGTATVIDPGAFSHYHAAYEYALGFNYYWKRQLLKWSTDIGYYQGGNPAAGGQSPTGDISGVDGYEFRTQLQLAF